LKLHLYLHGWVLYKYLLQPASIKSLVLDRKMLIDRSSMLCLNWRW